MPQAGAQRQRASRSWIGGGSHSRGESLGLKGPEQRPTTSGSIRPFREARRGRREHGTAITKQLDFAAACNIVVSPGGAS